MTTGEGHDTLSAERGLTKVTDFNTAQDQIDVSGNGINNFDQLRVSQRGNDTLVRAGGANFLLQDTKAADLSANNFAFAQQNDPAVY